jgi:hypothetical protein
MCKYEYVYKESLQALNLCFQKLMYVMGVSFFLLFTLAAVLSSAEAGANQNR